jgi:X-X-X-Leu-X-X-Gly heptad repeat protein
VSATVPSVLGLKLNNTLATLGSLTPGVAAEYEASLAATVTSTVGTAILSVADVSSGTGKLTNGATELASPLQLKATNAANPNTAFAPLTGAGNPLILLTYSTWISNDAVTIGIKQPIGANEPLTRGSYSKTITFTLSTTTP